MKAVSKAVVDKRRMSAPAIGGAVSVVIFWALQAIFPDLKVPLPVAAAGGAICTWVASILIPDHMEK